MSICPLGGWEGMPLLDVAPAHVHLMLVQMQSLMAFKSFIWRVWLLVFGFFWVFFFVSFLPWKSKPLEKMHLYFMSLTLSILYLMR